MAVSLPLSAEPIDITNCTAKAAKICAYDDSLEGMEIVGKHILGPDETRHFSCDDGCRFWISETCQRGHCAACGHLSEGYWLNHSRATGSYHLVSLATGRQSPNSSHNSSDLVEVQTGLTCLQRKSP